MGFGIITRNLSGRVTWMDLKDLGRKYGDITYSDANRIGDREGLITYASKKDMVNAYESMKGLEFMGRDLELEYEFPETAADEWTGDRKYGNYGNDKAGSASPNQRDAKSKSPSNGRFRDRSRSGVTAVNRVRRNQYLNPAKSI